MPILEDFPGRLLERKRRVMPMEAGNRCPDKWLKEGVPLAASLNGGQKGADVQVMAEVEDELWWEALDNRWSVVGYHADSGIFLSQVT